MARYSGVFQEELKKRLPKLLEGPPMTKAEIVCEACVSFLECIYERPVRNGSMSQQELDTTLERIRSYTC